MTTYRIAIPEGVARTLRGHLFQGRLEQAAFLFVRVERNDREVVLLAEDCYCVPSSGWIHQGEVYLEMKDEERGKIMKLARQRSRAVIDCHSHPGSGARVAFSPSDISGITDFAAYAKWKLPGQPYGAMVWSEKSVDAVVWDGDFVQALPVTEVTTGDARLLPRGTWRELRSYFDE